MFYTYRRIDYILNGVHLTNKRARFGTHTHIHTNVCILHMSIVMCVMSVTPELKLTHVIENNNIMVVCKFHKLTCSR